MKRRNFLASAGTFITAATVSCSTNESLQNVADSQRSFSVSGNVPLRNRARDKGLIYGAFSCTNAEQFQTDAALRAAFQEECDLVVGGFYWHRTRPDPNFFDWTLPDALFDFSQEYKKLFRGHPLVWHKLFPEWMSEILRSTDTTTSDIEQILETHISTIVRRYAGKVHSWDVVNEAIKPEHGRNDGLRLTPWLNRLGPEYLDFTYRIAAEADPTAMLVYNDYGLEYDSKEHSKRRKSLIKLLEMFKMRGTPVHAVGIQAHLDGAKGAQSMTTLSSFLADIASMGFKILITELDVKDPTLPSDINERDRMVAAVYEDFLTIALDQPSVISVITWGLSDKYTWLSDYAPRKDGMPVRPLPLDENMNRKSAWNAIARAFDATSPR